MRFYHKKTTKKLNFYRLGSKISLKIKQYSVLVSYFCYLLVFYSYLCPNF